MPSEINYIAELFTFIGAVLALGIILLIIFNLYQRKFKFSKQVKYLEQEHQKNLLQTQLEIQEQTFAYIAREIHDHVGQRLTLARLYLNSRKEISKEKMEQLIEESAHLIETAITDLKHLSRTLTADFIRDNGLPEALKIEIQHINAANELKLNLLLEGKVSFTDAETELVVFRIVQEALQNIIKHANAQHAQIKLMYQADQILVSIKDDGRGFDAEHFLQQPKQGLHSGILNMKTRVEFYKGVFKIDSQPNQGTTVYFQLPIKPLTTHAS